MERLDLQISVPTSAGATDERRFAQWRPLLLGLTAVLVVSLVSILYISRFTRYMSDDYCVALEVETNGVLSTVLSARESWSGRYAYTLLTTALMTLGPHVYALVPALLVVLWLLALVWLAYALFQPAPTYERRLLSVLAAGCTLYAVLTGTATFGQSLFWVTGATTYTLPLLLLTVYGAASLSYLTAAQPRLPFGLAAALGGLLLFFAAGLSEASTVLQLGVLALGIVAALRRSPPNRRTLVWLGIGLVATLIGMALVVSAPGNVIRQSRFPPPGPLPDMLGRSVENTLAFFAASVLFWGPFAYLVTLTVGALVGYLAGHHLFAEYRLTPRRVRVWLGLTLLVALALVAACVAPSAVFQSSTPPARLLILPHAVLVCVSAVWGFVMGRSLNRTRTIPEFAHVSRVALLAMGALMLLGPVASTLRMGALVAPLTAFAAEWDQADAAARHPVDGRPFTPIPLSDTAMVTMTTMGQSLRESIVCRTTYYETVAARRQRVAGSE